ncbi:MAG: hypothetical protein AABX85_00345 [Nanoarchaeota archaeon]
MNHQKNISGKELEGTITSDDILGKDVIDLDGRFIGITEKIFIHPETLDFVGISVDKGFLRKGLSIGSKFIERVASHAIFLKISISNEIRGLKVFDKNGKKIGKVIGVNLIGSGNEIDAIEVASAIGSIGVGKKLVILSKYIDKANYNILLNVTKKEVMDMQIV